ncbi:MAG: glycosyltransferase family 39 protein [Chloroflexota bacterium]
MATRHGVGLGSDSAVYIAAGRNWLRGFGLSWVSGGGEVSPVVIYPPLYSLVLAGFEVVGIDALEAARLVNVLFLCISATGVGLLVWRLTGRSAISLLGVLLTVSSGEFLMVHTWAMSEAPYIAFSLISAVLLVSFLSSRRLLILAASAAGVGLVLLTRYTGLSMAAAGAMVLLADTAAAARARVRNLMIFLAVSLTPGGLWLARTSSLAGDVAGRVLGWKIAELPPLAQQATIIVLNWFLPLRVVEGISSVPPVLVMAGAGVLLAGAAGLWMALHGGSLDPSSSGEITASMMLVPFLSATVHLMVVLIAATVTYPETHVNERTLAPAYPFLLTVLLIAIEWLWRSRQFIVRVALVLGMLILVRNKTVYAYWLVHGLQQDGQRYASAAWRNSETIAALRTLSPATIYTDDIAAVYLLADRYSYSIPRRFDAITGAYLETYPSDLDIMRQRLADQDGVLVLFAPQSIPGDMGPLEDLVVGLCLTRALADGVIYAPCPADGTP